MLQFISDIRPYIEALYFIAGVILSATLIFGYKQIRLVKDQLDNANNQLDLMKRDYQVRVEREAKGKAIQACADFETVLKLHITFTRDYLKRDMKSYDGPVGDFTPDSLDYEQKQMAKKKASLSSFAFLCNKLEFIASYFVHGIADERSGCDIFGRAYCGTVSALYDVISITREHKVYPKFNNIVRLYVIWSKRLSKEELKETYDAVRMQMESIEDIEIDVLG